MKKVSFGFSQLKSKTPAFIHWISVSGAGLLTLMAGLQALYPQYISDSIIAETAKILAAIRLLGQFFGVQPEMKEDKPE